MIQTLWEPSASRLASSRITAFQAFVEKRHDLTFNAYNELHRWSVESIPDFWRAVWDFCEIRASCPYDRVVEDLDRFPGARWFPGSRLNFAENLLNRRDDAIAIVALGEDGRRESLTYQELWRKVENLSSAMRCRGISAGDRVAAMMPNVAETVVAMLATTSIGAIWSSCSPDFGFAGVCARFEQIRPKLLLATTDYRYNGKVIDCSKKVLEIQRRLGSVEMTLLTSMVEDEPDVRQFSDTFTLTSFTDTCSRQPLRFEYLPFDHPLYILFSSGTTGPPKCIVHSAGGTLIQHLKEHRLHTDLRPSDRFFYFTTCGWMMWNWLVSGLASGCTLILFDGSPTARGGKVLLDAIEDERISIFGTSPKYIATIEKLGIEPAKTHDLSSLRTILSTGSPLTASGFDFIYEQVKPDVCLSSISGGTDIVSCFMLGNPTLPVNRGEIQCPGLGMAIEFRDADGHHQVNRMGELVCTRSFPCVPVGFFNDVDNVRFHDAYFVQNPGVWTHGDLGRITDQGGVIIHGRSDSVLNPSGVRIGTAEIYTIVLALREIEDCVAAGQQWEDDERIVLFVLLSPDVEELDDDLRTRIRTAIRTNATPRHLPAKIIAVEDIPRTVSGKISEVAVRRAIHGQPVENLDAIANPDSIDAYRHLDELLN